MSRDANVILRAALKWLPVFLWMGLIFALSAIPSLATPFEPVYDFTIKKFAHAAEYGILTALLFNALQIHIRRKPHALVVTALAATVFASSDEWHQTFVPGRDASLRDLGIDALGVVGVALWLALSEKKSEAFRTFI